ncbi:hypothetical protein evm_010773 [Chilo suppressalis]|nr:hypothetical protein evm_010773 [Chilo suppressalis]
MLELKFPLCSLIRRLAPSLPIARRGYTDSCFLEAAGGFSAGKQLHHLNVTDSHRLYLPTFLVNAGSFEGAGTSTITPSTNQYRIRIVCESEMSLSNVY